MTAARLRKWCLARPGATEEFPFGPEVSVFKVGGKIFAISGLQDPLKVSVKWETEREGPDEVFTITTEVVAVEGDTGVVRAEVAYGAPTNRLYRDLWIVRLDEHGRCFHFEEWPFWPERSRTAK